jgi:hypothetical protein
MAGFLKLICPSGKAKFCPTGYFVAGAARGHQVSELAFFTTPSRLNFRARTTAVHDRFALPFSLRMRQPLPG